MGLSHDSELRNLYSDTERIESGRIIHEITGQRVVVDGPSEQNLAFFG